MSTEHLMAEPFSNTEAGRRVREPSDGELKYRPPELSCLLVRVGFYRTDGRNVTMTATIQTKPL